MDVIFYYGDQQEKTPKFLEKLGYSIVATKEEQAVADLISKKPVDLILIDGKFNADVTELYNFFRANKTTSDVPIVCMTPEGMQSLGISVPDSEKRLEVLPASCSIGALASKVATQLRLRKVAGEDEVTSTLGEMNAALRDHNARFQKDLEEARAIQQNLLPKELPDDKRCSLGVSYQPLEQVGGDSYYIEHIKETDELHMHLADVSGHGLPAAFLASMGKLAMVAAEHVKPDALLQRMNELMLPQLPPGRFVTAGHVVYNVATGDLLWARGGHGPALIRRHDTKEVVELYGDGFPIGFVADGDYELIQAKLNPGDAVVLFTDGLTEAQNLAADQFGIERLAQTFSDVNGDATAQQMVSHIIDSFSAFLEGRLLKDDVTLVLLKRAVVS
jgi:serine phosphatase RsbU (regulator of sigma subunit)